jgi:tetratricopeptide (TPR) repeat protein
MKRILHSVCVSLLILGGFAFQSTQANAQASDSRVKAALKLIDLNNSRDAVVTLHTLTQQEPKNAEAHAALALAYLAMGNAPQAASETSTAYDLDRKNVLVRIARAAVAGSQKRVNDAISEYYQAIKLNDKEVGSYLALSRYYISIDSLKPAEIMLYRAQSINDKDVRPFLGLADLYERQRIPDLAIKQYEQAKRLDPSDVTVMAKLAAMYLRGKHYNESINEWLHIVKVDSTYPDSYYQIANLYFLDGDYAQAATYAEKYAQLRPDDLDGQWLYARALTEVGQYQKALPPLERLQINDSLKALSAVLRARGYFYAHEYQKALDIFKSATNMSPMDYDIYGKALIVTGDTAAGIEQLKASLVNDTVRKPEVKTAEQTLIGQMLYAQKRYADAAKIFESMADANPSPEYYLTAAEVYSTAGQPEQAAAMYDKALAKDPTSLKVLMSKARAESKDLGSQKTFDAWQKLIDAATAKNDDTTAAVGYGWQGYYYATKKDWKKAVDVLEKAVKGLEATKSAYRESFMLLLAQSYHQLMNVKKADEYYNRVLAINPNNKDAKQGLELLHPKATK